MILRDKRIIALELGTKKLRAVEVTQAHERFEISKTCSTQVPEGFDARTTEDKGKFIADFMDQNNFKGKRAVVWSIPRQLAILRQINLPPADESEIENMVKFQAERELPLSLDQVKVNYKVISQPDTDQLKVLLVAVPRDIIEKHQAILESAQVKIRAMYVSSLGTFNAYRMSQTTSALGTLALIDIGLESMEISVIKDNQMAFSRSTPLKELHPTESWLEHIYAELDRSFKSYAAQAEGDKITRLFICGEGVKATNLKDLLAEQLKLPADYLTPLLTDKTTPSTEPVALATITGLGLAYLWADGIKINLYKTTFGMTKKADSKKASLIAAGIILLLIIAIIGPRLILQGKQSQLNELTQEAERLRPRAEEIKQLSQKINYVKQWYYNKNPWLDILRDISALFPKDIYVTNLSFEETGVIKIKGKAEDSSDVTLLNTKLNKSPYFKDTKLDYIKMNNEPGKFRIDYSLTTRKK